MMPGDKLDLAARVALATDVARRVGRDASAFRESAGSAALQVETKGTQDFVTIANKLAETAIRAAMLEQFPTDGFMGEERMPGTTLRVRTTQSIKLPTHCQNVVMPK